MRSHHYTTCRHERFSLTNNGKQSGYELNFVGLNCVPLLNRFQHCCISVLNHTHTRREQISPYTFEPTFLLFDWGLASLSPIEQRSSIRGVSLSSALKSSHWITIHTHQPTYIHNIVSSQHVDLPNGTLVQYNGVCSRIVTQSLMVYAGNQEPNIIKK